MCRLAPLYSRRLAPFVGVTASLSLPTIAEPSRSRSQYSAKEQLVTNLLRVAVPTFARQGWRPATPGRADAWRHSRPATCQTDRAARARTPLRLVSRPTGQ